MKYKLLCLLLVLCVNNYWCQWVKLTQSNKEHLTTESVLSVLMPLNDAVHIDKSVFKISDLSWLQHFDDNSYNRIADINVTVPSLLRVTLNPNISRVKDVSEAMHKLDIKRMSLSYEENNRTDSITGGANDFLKNPISLFRNLSIVDSADSFTVFRLPLTDKIKFLKNMHNMVLLNAYNIFHQLWPNKQKRDVRSFKDNHVDFPSTESALMTISFLAFAVYLIKLVLQVINILKSKKNMYTPMMTTTGRSFTKKNSYLEDNINKKILRMMENLQNTT